MNSPRRQQINRFLDAHPVAGPLIDVGAGRRGWVPHSNAEITTVDCRPGPGVDVVASIDVMVPLPGAAFAGVKMTEVLDLIADPRCALREARRLLWTDGALILTVPFMRPVTEQRDRHRLTPLAWRALLAGTGFHIETLAPLGGLPTLLAEIAYQRAQRRATRRLIAGPLAALARVLEVDDRPPAWTCGYGIIARAV